jgi:hypothetical protein
MIKEVLDAPGKIAELVKVVRDGLRARRRKKILRAMLDDPAFRWRSLTTLATAIGLPEQETRELLSDVGARASTRPESSELWGLVDRHGRSGTATDR